MGGLILPDSKAAFSSSAVSFWSPLASAALKFDQAELGAHAVVIGVLLVEARFGVLGELGLVLGELGFEVSRQLVLADDGVAVGVNRADVLLHARRQLGSF